MTAPKTAKQKWEAVVEYAASRDVESLADMTEEEIDRELAAKGPEAVALAAEGVAEHEAAVRAAAAKATASQEVAPTRPARDARGEPRGKPRRLGALGWGAGAIAAAAAAAVGVNALAPEVFVGHPREDNPDAARPVRVEATKACEAGQWAECLRLLDEAKALDAKGDKTPVVTALRATAEARIAEAGAR